MLWVNPGATGNSHERLKAMKRKNRPNGANVNANMSQLGLKSQDSIGNHAKKTVKSAAFKKKDPVPIVLTEPAGIRSEHNGSNDIDDVWAAWAAQHPESAL
ncbi:MAG: hypothetical protein RLY66_665 [Candidatus Parcubacteria bacterium]|jgi:hypothetical protein